MSAAVAAIALRAAIEQAIADATQQALPFVPTHAQVAAALQPVVKGLLDLGQPAAVDVLRAYPGRIAGTWAAHVLAECKSAWSLAA